MTRETRILGIPTVVTADEKDQYYQSLPEDFDDDVVTFLGRIIESDMTVVDVGANMGLTAIAASRLAPQGHVHAFEANPKVAGWLTENLRLNGATNASVHAAAVAAQPGELTLFDNEDFAAGSTLLDSANEIARKHMSGEYDGKRHIVKVKAVTIDDFVAEQKIDKVDLLKVDVEGYDIDVIRGAAKTISAMHPTVVMEFATFAITTHRQLLPADVLAEFRGVFDHVYVIERWGMLRELVDDPKAWDFLYENANFRPVQDIVGAFEDSRMYPLLSELASPRAGGTHPPPDYLQRIQDEAAKSDELRTQLHEAREAEAALRATVADLEQRVDAGVREQEAIKTTLSWRITKPLRSVRKIAPKKD